MRRIVDFFLVVVLLGAIAVLFFVLGDRMGGVWFATPTVTPLSLPTRAPTRAATLTPAGTTGATATAGATASRTATATASLTPTSTSVPSVTATPAAASASPTGSNALAAEINQGIQNGDLIVQAIEAYYQAQNAYPATLEDLVPIFLPSLPVTGAGQEYRYRLFDASSPLAGEAYWVAFKITSQEHAACTYMRRLDFWDCNFESP